MIKHALGFMPSRTADTLDACAIMAANLNMTLYVHLNPLSHYVGIQYEHGPVMLCDISAVHCDSEQWGSAVLEHQWEMNR